MRHPSSAQELDGSWGGWGWPGCESLAIEEDAGRSPPAIQCVGLWLLLSRCCDAFVSLGTQPGDTAGNYIELMRSQRTAATRGGWPRLGRDARLFRGFLRHTLLSLLVRDAEDRNLQGQVVLRLQARLQQAEAEERYIPFTNEDLAGMLDGQESSD